MRAGVRNQGSGVRGQERRCPESWFLDVHTSESGDEVLRCFLVPTVLRGDASDDAPRRSLIGLSLGMGLRDASEAGQMFRGNIKLVECDFLNRLSRRCLRRFDCLHMQRGVSELGCLEKMGNYATCEH